MLAQLRLGILLWRLVFLTYKMHFSLEYRLVLPFYLLPNSCLKFLKYEWENAKPFLFPFTTAQGLNKVLLTYVTHSNPCALGPKYNVFALI